jgi:hypothetical protein
MSLRPREIRNERNRISNPRKDDRDCLRGIPGRLRGRVVNCDDDVGLTSDQVRSQGRQTFERGLGESILQEDSPFLNIAAFAESLLKSGE